MIALKLEVVVFRSVIIDDDDDGDDDYLSIRI